MNKTELSEFYAAHLLGATQGHVNEYGIMESARRLADEAINWRNADKIRHITRITKKHPRYGKFRFWLRNLKIRIEEML